MIVSFFAGTFIGELMPDPTDPIHFYLIAHPELFSTWPRWAKAIYLFADWYLLSASFMFLLFILAWFMGHKKLGKPIVFIELVGLLMIIMITIVAGMLVTYALGWNF